MTGADDGVIGEREKFFPDAVNQLPLAASGKIGPADRARKENVAAEEVFVDKQRAPRRAVAGNDEEVSGEVTGGEVLYEGKGRN